MSDQTTADEQSEVSSTDNTATDGADDQDHDCQQHLEFVEYEWVEDAWDETYVCNVCEEEFCEVYLRAFLLDGDDYSLVEEYTDEIERKLEQHRNHDRTEANEAGKPANG